MRFATARNVTIAVFATVTLPMIILFRINHRRMKLNVNGKIVLAFNGADRIDASCKITD